MVLVHSPSVGPSTWVPVAQCLHRRGVDAVVPNLRHVGTGGPPYWPRVAGTVAEAMGQLDEPGPVLLVAHSNAGLFLPVVTGVSRRTVAGAILVDAAVPAEGGPSEVVPPEFLEFLRGLADDRRRLPRWTDWWPDEDIASLLPDPVMRAQVVDDQPRLPLDYYEQTVPVPGAWWSVPCAYLQFSAAYDSEAARARRAGWPVRVLRGEHLHQVVDPDGVTDALVRIAADIA